MKHLLLIAIVFAVGCDVIEPVGVDIKGGQAPAKDYSRRLFPSPSAEKDVVFGELIKERYSGKVVKTTDGDTVTVLVGKEQIKVRLASIDAPERRQPFGEKSKDRLAEAVQAQEVEVAQTDVDRYGRRVGFILLEVPTSTPG